MFADWVLAPGLLVWILRGRETGIPEVFTEELVELEGRFFPFFVVLCVGQSMEETGSRGF